MRVCVRAPCPPSPGLSPLPSPSLPSPPPPSPRPPLSFFFRRPNRKTAFSTGLTHRPSSAPIGSEPYDEDQERGAARAERRGPRDRARAQPTRTSDRVYRCRQIAGDGAALLCSRAADDERERVDEEGLGAQGPQGAGDFGEEGCASQGHEAGRRDVDDERGGFQDGEDRDVGFASHHLRLRQHASASASAKKNRSRLTQHARSPFSPSPLQVARATLGSAVGAAAVALAPAAQAAQEFAQVAEVSRMICAFHRRVRASSASSFVGRGLTRPLSTRDAWRVASSHPSRASPCSCSWVGVRSWRASPSPSASSCGGAAGSEMGMQRSPSSERRTGGAEGWAHGIIAGARACA